MENAKARVAIADFFIVDRIRVTPYSSAWRLCLREILSVDTGSVLGLCSILIDAAVGLERRR